VSLLLILQNDCGLPKVIM